MIGNKILSVLLASAIVAGMLSGCSKEIIEHQIITEIIGNGGSTGGSQQETAVVEADPVVQGLEELLKEHGLYLEIYIADANSVGPFSPFGPSPVVDLDKVDSNYTDYSVVTQEEFNDWINGTNKNSVCVYRRWEPDELLLYSSETTEYLSNTVYFDAVFKQLEIIKGYFSQLNETEWESIELNDDQKIKGLVISIQNFRLKGTNDIPDKYFTELAFNWKLYNKSILE